MGEDQHVIGTVGPLEVFGFSKQSIHPLDDINRVDVIETGCSVVNAVGTNAVLPQKRRQIHQQRHEEKLGLRWISCSHRMIERAHEHPVIIRMLEVWVFGLSDGNALRRRGVGPIQTIVVHVKRHLQSELIVVVEHDGAADCGLDCFRRCFQWCVLDIIVKQFVVDRLPRKPFLGAAGVIFAEKRRRLLFRSGVFETCQRPIQRRGDE
mmetsp:Transcript_28291/g.79476  ORF Transcript_28291/g.79476 Transcript_28291/m.79476 type:complete len:208 (-) Transcript_28291:103-726(-)